MFETNGSVLWGTNLKKAIHEVRPVREFLIENFLYKKSSQMIYAPDGAGKSLITLQATIQGTVDNNRVFGDLYVEKGFKTFYIQAERDVAENLERMRHMIETTPFNESNFLLCPDLQGIDLHNENHKKSALEHIERLLKDSFGVPDLIVMDPIYAMVRGGLRDDDGAAMVTDFSRTLQARYGCSILLIHHANRGTRNKETGGRDKEDMFGSRFLSAFCTGVYKLTLRKDEMGAQLELEKSSNENLQKLIELHYDGATQLSWAVKKGAPEGSKTDKAYSFLRMCKANKKSFSFSEFKAATDLSTSFARGLLVDTLKNDVKVVDKLSRGKLLYEYTGH